MNWLGQSYKRKVLSSKIAKEKWDALEIIYQGSNDVKRDMIMTLWQDYDNLLMKDKEKIEDFQVRFLILINSLAHLWEYIPNWK